MRALVLVLVLVWPSIAAAKKKGLKDTDLICNACETVIAEIEDNLRHERRRDEGTVSDKVDGICENMTYWSLSREWPRQFIKASGYGKADHGASVAAEGAEPKPQPGSNANPVKVVGVKHMHDRKADAKLKKYCMQHMDSFEEDLIKSLRYSAPSESVVEELCYKYVPECAQRDEQGADLVAKTLRKPLVSDFPST
eukprot:SAG11_NODE_2928_length_2831_cov_24.172767_4_plen_196_part_00